MFQSTPSLATILKVSAIALVASMASGAAQAGDLNHRGSLKDPVERQGRLPEPEVQQERGVNWSGFYIGGHAGWGITSGTATTVDTQHFNAVPSKCWANLGFSTDQITGFDGKNINVGLKPNGDTDFGIVGTPLPDGPADDRDHVIQGGANASITNVTEDECAAIRDDLGLTNPQNQPPAGSGLSLTSGYDPAVDAHDVVTTTRESFHDSGFEGGVRLGADLARGGFLGGVFGEYNWSAVEEHNGDWLIAGRAGAIVGGRTLIYGLVGYAQADFGDIDFGGVAVGGGIEYALTKNLFINGEYVHTFYDDEKVGNTTIELDSDKVRAGLKYKIGTDEAPF